LISFSLSLPLALEQNGFKRFNALLQPGQALEFLMVRASADSTVSRQSLHTYRDDDRRDACQNQDQRPFDDDAHAASPYLQVPHA
jgi:hypothetical protein